MIVFFSGSIISVMGKISVEIIELFYFEGDKDNLFALTLP